MNFDESLTHHHSNGIFGIPAKRDSSKIVLLPVPWEVTTSYGSGASLGPQAILEASPQIDLFAPKYPDNWKQGFFWDTSLEILKERNDKLKPLAQEIVHQLEAVGELSAQDQIKLDQVNLGCQQMVQSVYEKTKGILAEGRIPAVVGGDHSTPEGLIQAIGEFCQGEYGILHIDAHHDLRQAYQGFRHSHASIMYNILQQKHPPKSLVQVGIRDFCKQEFQMAQSDPRIHCFWDVETNDKLYSGTSWNQICKEMLAKLPQQIYISFDIDGLSPDLCPSTGTPVPGGLSYGQAMHLLDTIVEQNKHIVGFDLNEVAPGEGDWDGNVGSRVLYQLCNVTSQSTMS